MTLLTTWNAAISIPRGSLWEDEWTFLDPTGEPLNWDDGWVARLQVMSDYLEQGGTLLATLSTEGADGDLQLLPFGLMTTYLGSDFTATLEPRRDLVWDLRLTDPSGNHRRPVRGRGEITSEVTTDA